MSPDPGLVRPAQLLLLGLWLGSASCAVTSKGADAPGGESWSLTVDNDSYNFDDGNYTNGVELQWVSAAIEDEPGSSLSRTIQEALRWLPGLGDEHSHSTSLSASHLVFTPESLIVANPGPDERPYAGVLVFDGAILARDLDSLTAYVLRLGLVGDLSGAEELQKEIHPWFGAEDPEGWDTQLENEPVINVGWIHRRLLRAGAPDEPSSFDLTPEFSAHAGTYYTGAGAALRARFGFELPATLGALPPRTGFEVHPRVGQPAAAGSACYGFLDLEGHAVAHYLPIDGNVFRDSRSAERIPFVGKASFGVSLGGGPWVLSLAYSLLTDVYDAQRKTGQFGTISLTWLP